MPLNIEGFRLYCRKAQRHTLFSKPFVCFRLKEAPEASRSANASKSRQNEPSGAISGNPVKTIKNEPKRPPGTRVSRKAHYWPKYSSGGSLAVSSPQSGSKAKIVNVLRSAATAVFEIAMYTPELRRAPREAPPNTSFYFYGLS